ncbi:pyridoxamine 5'-phosphate oxidase family protein [Halovivax sp.]|uniref:pyridoxamine 5'-phosphate oxidase family protein n=1 Tax=Halovivax sp. TaxID=1935978 RepID=UPI0025BEE6D8|nr:pyridoxamine 5'-phosphate oxidase family protein [Halovivax sp.]
MEIVDRTLEDDLDAVLDRPLFCFLAQTSSEGHPRLSPLWYLWEDDRIWIIADTVEKSYATRVERTPETAVAIVDFDAETGRVRHVGMRGRAEIVPFDEERANRLLARYLGPDREAWDERFVDIDPDRWGLIRFEPETVVARDQSFSPSLERTLD